MTSFAAAIEPCAQPRLAALALAVHAGAAASPWLAHVPPVAATILSVAALAGLASTLAAVPGRHHRLAALAIDGGGCRVRLREADGWQRAELGPRSRAFPGLVFLDVRVACRRVAWLLPRGAAPPGAFRALKARVRLNC